MIGSNGSFGVGTSMKHCEAAVVFKSLLEMNVLETKTPSTTGKPDDGSGQYDTAIYTVTADTNKDGWSTYAEVKAVMDCLQAEYPTGTPWGFDKYYQATE